jgi:hypothetical protein
MPGLRAYLGGFRNLIDRLRELAERADAGVDERTLLAEFFPVDFMREHTVFSSLEEMFQESGFVIHSKEDLERIPDDTWDAYVQRNTDFDSWEEMAESATSAWFKAQLRP